MNIRLQRNNMYRSQTCFTETRGNTVCLYLLIIYILYDIHLDMCINDCQFSFDTSPIVNVEKRCE